MACNTSGRAMGENQMAQKTRLHACGASNICTTALRRAAQSTHTHHANAKTPPQQRYSCVSLVLAKGGWHRDGIMLGRGREEGRESFVQVGRQAGPSRRPHSPDSSKCKGEADTNGTCLCAKHTLGLCP